jgi:hypothetical protein
MALQYISEDRLRIDEIIENVIDQGDTLDNYYTMVNDEVEAVCNAEGVLTANIPVDVDGYVTSSTLRMYATFYALWIINNGYRGSGGGEDDDVYGKSADDWKVLYQEKRSELTKEVINGDDGTTIINPQNTVRQAFFAI